MVFFFLFFVCSTICMSCTTFAVRYFQRCNVNSQFPSLLLSPSCVRVFFLFPLHTQAGLLTPLVPKVMVISSTCTLYILMQRSAWSCTCCIKIAKSKYHICSHRIGGKQWQNSNKMVARGMTLTYQMHLLLSFPRGQYRLPIRFPVCEDPSALQISKERGYHRDQSIRRYVRGQAAGLEFRKQVYILRACFTSLSQV